MKKLIMAFILTLGYTSANAQFIEDALRYAGTNTFVTPRVAGLNVAYYGIADDIGALVTNPAGMTLIRQNEFSLGFGFTHTTNDLSMSDLSLKNTFKINNEFLSNVAFAVPVKTTNGYAAVGVGYFKEQDFRNSYDYSVFNTKSSYIGEQADAQQLWTYDLLLADSNYVTKIRKNVGQTVWVDEKGGIHNISGGAAFDINESVSLGFSLTGKWGGYDYIRDFTEADVHNIYTTYQVDDFNRVDIRETVSQAVSGITGTIGLQGRIEDFMRIGVAIKMPTWYEINETFSRDIKAEFDPSPEFGQIDRFYDTLNGSNSYNITTPFIYSAGLSFYALGLTFSTGVEYSDVTQLEFSDATETVQQKLDMLNRIAIKSLVGQVTWGFGAEYKVPTMPLIARASYAKTTSPYQQDIANANKSMFSLGGSLILGKSVRIDGVMRWIDVSEQRTAYGSVENPATFSKYEIANQPLNIAIGLTYRY